METKILGTQYESDPVLFAADGALLRLNGGQRVLVHLWQACTGQVPVGHTYMMGLLRG